LPPVTTATGRSEDTGITGVAHVRLVSHGSHLAIRRARPWLESASNASRPHLTCSGVRELGGLKSFIRLSRNAQSTCDDLDGRRGSLGLRRTGLTH
jgi:hypothetical protein